MRALVVAIAIALTACGGDEEEQHNASSNPPPNGCCRVCTIGKACGDSCINVDLTSHQPPGCACNG
jgi:hypothetical protein